MAGKHHRNMDGLEAAQRCGATTRCGQPCRSPAVRGGLRCRMHGGKGSGAPQGNRNAQKHGAYNAKVRGIRAMRFALEEQMRKLVSEVDVLN